jgi:hypothetical protein
VPYQLELQEKMVVRFLEDSERISPAMREVIAGTSIIRFDIVMTDPETAQWRRFWFTVSDAAAQFGVLRVLLIEEAS